MINDPTIDEKPVSIDTYNPDPPQTVSIDDPQRPYQLPVDELPARVRAFKAAYGLRAVAPKPEEDIYNNLVSGYEDVYRKQIASEVDQKYAEDSQKLITGMAASYPEMITSGEFEQAVQRLNERKPENPNVIFEKYYGKTYVDGIERAALNQPSFVPNAKMELGDAFGAVKTVASDMIAKQQILRRLAQDIVQQDVANQSWIGYGADFAKGLLQSYVEWKKRGNVPGTGFFEGGPLGTNLKLQSLRLFELPLDEFEPAVKKILDPIRADNPQLAAQYAMELAGQTSEEQFVNNWMTLMMPINTAGLVTGIAAGREAKAASGLFQGKYKPEEARKMSQDLGTKISNIEVVTTDPVDRPTPKVLSELNKQLAGLREEKRKVDEYLGADAATLFEKTKRAAVSVVTSTTNEPHTPSTIAAASGDLKTAAIKDVAEEVDNAVFKGQSDELERARKALPTNFRSDMLDVQAAPGVRGQDLANRIIQSYDLIISAVEKGLLTRKRIDKMPGVFESEEAVRKIEESIRNSGHFNGIESAIADISFYRNPISNTIGYDIKLTNHHGQLFHDAESAYQFGQLHGIPDLKLASIEKDQQGIGYYIRLRSRPFRETDSVFRDLLIPTKDQVAPSGLLRSWMGWAINPDETLSKSDRENRKLASYGPQYLMQVAEVAAKTLQSFSRGATLIDPLTGKAETRQLLGMRKRWKEWERMLKAGKTMPNPTPEDPYNKGYFFKSPQEIENFYQNNFGRLPEAAEIQAYFAYKQITEWDRILRDLAVYTQQWRAGAQEHTFTILDKEGKAVQPVKFTGMLEHRLPSGGGTVAIIGDTIDQIDVRQIDRMGNTRKKIADGIEEGRLKLIRIFNPEERPFSGLGGINDDHRVQFVVVNNLESKPISFNQLPRKGGGHWDFDHPFYIKQAKMMIEKFGSLTHHWYEGDTTIMPIAIRKMGQDVVNHLNEVREYIRKGEVDSAQFYAEKHLGSIGWDTIKSWFEPRYEKGVVKRAWLSVDEPIQLVEKGKQIVDTSKEALAYRYEKVNKRGEKTSIFMDGTKQGNPARQSQIEYTGLRDGRDIYTIKDKGSQYNPLYSYESAEMVDPISTMNRALTKITNSNYLEDYKMFAVEHWLRAAKPFLNEEDKAINSTPLFHFHHPLWKAGVSTEVRRNLENQRWQIKQFLGVQNEVDNMIQSTMQKMADEIYGRFGPKAVKFVPQWALGSISDPISFIKQVTYHAALGIFSIPQLFVQMQTWALTAALAPRSVAAGTLATMLHGWAALNPSMVATLDKYAAKFRIPGLHSFKLGQFEEARKLGLETGFFSVQGEHAFLADSMAGNKIVKNGFTQLLDWGTAPFKAGERTVRLNAWYTAYVEFRKANPLLRLGDKEVGQILNRADDLYANMSRASSSSLHSGVFGITTQFLSYQLRLAELFLGSRTSMQDKGRILAVMSLLYGVPMATGVTGLPLGDYIRRKSIEDGYVVGDNYLRTGIEEGLPSLLIGMLTGNYYNIGERYGAGGMELLRDIARNDKTIFSLIGGAAWSKMSGVFESADPFWAAIQSVIRGDDKVFPIVASDFAQPLREISSVNNVWRTIAALNTGRWLSKKGAYLDDVSPLNAIFQGITGLQSQKAADLQSYRISAKDFEEFKKEYINKFSQEFKNGLRIAEKDPAGARDLFTRAFVYLHMSGARDDEFTQALGQATRDNESLVRQMDWQYYIAKAPKDKQKQFIDAFTRKTIAQGQGKY